MRKDTFGEQKINKIQLIMYLIPLVGCLPALWTLYNNQGNSEQKSVSRLSIKVTLIWLLAYGALWLGSVYTPETLSLRLLYLNGLITTGYILTCLGVIISLWHNKKIGIDQRF